MVAPGSVTARATQRDPQTAGPLLGDHDRVELAASDVLRAGAALTNAVANTLEELGVFLDQILGTQRTAGLLVGQAAEDHVTGGRTVLVQAPQQRRDHHRDPTLHVERSSTPHPAIHD